MPFRKSPVTIGFLRAHQHQASSGPIKPCAAAADGKGVVYTGSCFSNLFLSDITSLSTAADKPGLICPTVHMARPSNLSNLTTAFFYNFVAADPLLYSYSNCSCALPLQPRYLRDNAGMASCSCIPAPTEGPVECDPAPTLHSVGSQCNQFVKSHSILLGDGSWILYLCNLLIRSHRGLCIPNSLYH